MKGSPGMLATRIRESLGGMNHSDGCPKEMKMVRPEKSEHFDSFERDEVRFPVVPLIVVQEK
jgi:hypothetical protein